VFGLIFKLRVQLKRLLDSMFMEFIVIETVREGIMVAYLVDQDLKIDTFLVEL
jgi:hypothetical protein